jgi:hypothetical protein
MAVVFCFIVFTYIEPVQTIDTDLIIEYTGNHMVNNLETTIKKRSG